VAPGDDRCPSCGATGEPGRLYCGQCGARVAQGVADLEAYRSGPERFDRVAVAGGYAAAMRYAPELSVALEVGWPIVRLAAGAALVAWFAVAAVASGDLRTMAVVGVGGSILLARLAQGVVVGMRRSRAPTERLVAIVAEERYVATGFKSDPVGTCEHKLVLRDRDGEARAVFAPAAVMGEVAIGDIGVAFLRRDRLVDYRWFDIMAPPLEPGEMPRASGCDNCGARQPFGPVSDRCAFCGAALARPDLGEFGARFRAAAASPAAAAATSHQVRGGLPPLWQPLVLLAGGLFFAWFAWQARELLGAAVRYSAWFTIAIGVLLGPALVGAVWLWRRLAPHRAPRENQLAVVVRTRAQMVRKHTQDPGWRHFATIAGPSGGRRELSVMPAVSGKLRRGQIGVAHLRGDWLAGFTPVEEG
jgi:hypothetical protein